MRSIILLIKLWNVNTRSKFQFGWMLFLKLDFVEISISPSYHQQHLNNPKANAKKPKVEGLLGGFGRVCSVLKYILDFLSDFCRVI